MATPPHTVDIEALYETYGPMVLRRCRRLLGDEEAAVDAMHDTFVLLLRHKDRLSATYPSSLLYTMATNVCLNILRKNKHAPRSVDDAVLARIATGPSPLSAIHASHLFAQLIRPHQPSTRTMAVMHYVDGMTLEEVAKETGMSVSGVRKRLRPLRAQLQKWMRSAEGEP